MSHCVRPRTISEYLRIGEGGAETPNILLHRMRIKTWPTWHPPTADNVPPDLSHLTDTCYCSLHRQLNTQIEGFLAVDVTVV